jgi:hypothetical protein
MMGRRTDQDEATPPHPEQIVRKLREGERLLNEGKDLTEVIRHLEVSEATWNRWRNQCGCMNARGQAPPRVRGRWSGAWPP